MMKSKKIDREYLEKLVLFLAFLFGAVTLLKARSTQKGISRVQQIHYESWKINNPHSFWWIVLIESDSFVGN
jgi:hypothetical protein